jgi:hypothetical protein
VTSDRTRWPRSARGFHVTPRTVRADEYPSRVARARKASAANSAGHSGAHLAEPVPAGAPESPPRPDLLRPRHMRSRVPCPQGAAASRTEVHLAQSLDSFPAEVRRVHRRLPFKERQVPAGDVTANGVSVPRATQPGGLRVARASRRLARHAPAGRAEQIGRSAANSRAGRLGLSTTPIAGSVRAARRWSRFLARRSVRVRSRVLATSDTCRG